MRKIKGRQLALFSAETTTFVGGYLSNPSAETAVFLNQSECTRASYRISACDTAVIYGEQVGRQPFSFKDFLGAASAREPAEAA
jgi:hypothetical protein